MDRIDAMRESRRLSPGARGRVDRRLLEAGMGRDDPLAVLVVLEVSLEEKLAQVRGLPAVIAQELDSAGQRQAAAHAEAVVAGVQSRLAPALEAMGRRSVLAVGRRSALGLVAGALLCLGAGMLIGEQRLLARQVPLTDMLAVRPDADSWASLIAANPFSLDRQLQRHCGEGGEQARVLPSGQRACTVPLLMPGAQAPAPQSLAAQLWQTAETRMARVPVGLILLAALSTGLVVGLVGRAAPGRVARWAGARAPVRPGAAGLRRRPRGSAGP